VIGAIGIVGGGCECVGCRSIEWLSVTNKDKWNIRLYDIIKTSIVPCVSGVVSGSLDLLAFTFDHLFLLSELVLLTRSQYFPETNSSQILDPNSRTLPLYIDPVELWIQTPPAAGDLPSVLATRVMWRTSQKVNHLCSEHRRSPPPPLHPRAWRVISAIFPSSVAYKLKSGIADIISAVEFDSTGNYLATGDKGGRVVLFERNDMVCPCPSIRSTNHR
jgi:hypothetical protein